MIKLLDILLEIADSPYTLSPAKEQETTKFDSYVDYNFETAAKREYYVRFTSKWAGRDKKPEQKYNWVTELTFFPVELRTDSSTEVGGENFGKILATVLDALNKFVVKYKPEYVFWKGIISNKEEKPGSTDSSKRQRIYNLILDRETKGISGYESVKGTKASGILFKGDIPVPGASPIFKYPEEPSLYDAEKSKAKLSRFNLSRG
jgi:hypothetical protein